MNDEMPKNNIKRAPRRTVELDGIKDPLKMIPGSNNYFVTDQGEFYRRYKTHYTCVEARMIRQTGGYRYVHLYDGNGGNKTYRAHRLVAKTWIPNPDNLPIVGHKNNIKSDNRVENLYWTTIAENSQKAVDEGLSVNAKGFDDSQSMPVVCFDMSMKPIKVYGSICEAHKELRVSKSTISRQARHEHHTKPRTGYYFRYKSEVDKEGFVL